MANLHAFWIWTDEGLHHDLIDHAASLNAISTKVYCQAFIAAQTTFEYPALQAPFFADAIQALHPSLIADLVQTLVSHDGQPAFGRLHHIDSNQSVVPGAVLPAAGDLRSQPNG